MQPLCHRRSRSRDGFHTPRLVRRLGLGLVLLIVLLALVVLFENLRGQRAWDRHQREWIARGEVFTWQQIVPPPVPEEQNLALAPVFKPLFDYTFGPKSDGQPGRMIPGDEAGLKRLREVQLAKPSGIARKMPASGEVFRHTFTDLAAWQLFFSGNTNYPGRPAPGDAAHDVLLALSRFDDVLKEIEEAAATRPLSRFPIHYEENFNSQLQHLQVLRQLAAVLHLRAVGRLEAGRASEALDDLQLMLRLSDALSTEPLLISHLVRLALLETTLQTWKEGLARHAWNDAQLGSVIEPLGNINLLAEIKNALRGERVLGLEALNLGRAGQAPGAFPESFRYVPLGWIRQNQLHLSRALLEGTGDSIDEQAQRVQAERLLGSDAAVERLPKNPYTVLARMILPALGKATQRTVRAQTMVNLARLAGALERHRLANGQYPDSLESLVPRYVPKLPLEIVSGELLKYQRGADGEFTLTSAGWGESGIERTGAETQDEAGWTWRSGRP